MSGLSMSGPHAVFRADASPGIGTGHLIRCRTLAASLVAGGWRATFVTQDLPDALLGSLASLEIAVTPLPRDAPMASEPSRIGDALPSEVALVVGDHYGLYADWYDAVAGSRPGAALMAIDDLADRPLPVDLVLNQNLGATTGSYAGLVPTTARILAAPRFALLRPEFAAERASGRIRDGRVDRILVFMSGGDLPDVTSRVVDGLASFQGPVDVVVGGSYPHLPSLRAMIDRRPAVTLHVDTPDMAALMDRADLAIGAVGGATWERCAVGLPTIVVTLADNQAGAERALVDSGAAIGLGRHEAVTAADVDRVVRSLCADPARVAAMSTAAAAVTDGRGTERVRAEVQAVVAERGEVR